METAVTTTDASLHDVTPLTLTVSDDDRRATTLTLTVSVEASRHCNPSCQLASHHVASRHVASRRGWVCPWEKLGGGSHGSSDSQEAHLAWRQSRVPHSCIRSPRVSRQLFVTASHHYRQKYRLSPSSHASTYLDECRRLERAKGTLQSWRKKPKLHHRSNHGRRCRPVDLSIK